MLEISLALDYGYNRTRPYNGALPEEFTAQRTRIIPINRQSKTAEVAKGVVVPLDRPFFGTDGPRAGPFHGSHQQRPARRSYWKSR